MLRRKDSKGSGLICLELISSKGKDVIKIDILDVAKALLRVCSDARLDIVTTITKHGYRSIIKLGSGDIVRCKDVFGMLLRALISDDVVVNEVSCDETEVGQIPLHISLSMGEVV